ncbi:MAG: DUF5916 domain-containing protein [Vicinamibacterales bacterium]|nr:DUF5916 domain-containing protein [Vicinamibacterales bacterium]
MVTLLRRTARARIAWLLGLWAAAALVTAAHAQETAPPVVTSQRPSLAAGALGEGLRIDGRLDEDFWRDAPAADGLTMSEPTPGGAATGRTVVRVVADSRVIVFGIRCDDPDAAGIVSFTKSRDASLQNEDHVKVVVDTFQDGRSGYVFAVNPGGARYDALIEPGGENENANWDGLWEAATVRDADGWGVEIRVPVSTLSFRPGLRAWNFNVQRRVQRLQEVARWSGWSRDYKITHVSQAGTLTGLPEFDLGLGLSIRPAVVGGAGRPAAGAEVETTLDPSLDVTQRLGSNLLGSLTVNTDFAETEVDTRRTNFTRFPLFFPEKRTFFLDGADIFSFGLGLGQELLPYYSRRVGLVAGREVPIVAGGKVSGRAGSSNIGAQLVRTDSVGGVAPGTTLGVVRLKQNVLAESSVGLIATLGDPHGRANSWLIGADATYQTSHARGNKNLMVGLWGLAMDREGLGPDRSAFGVTVDYPNDRWDTVFKYWRVGRDFDPSMGFVARPAVHALTFNTEFKPRPGFWNIRQMFVEFRNTLVTDLDGQWESYRVFAAPVNWRFESGDRVEVNWVPTGEYLARPFEVADGVVLAPGSYHWTRYRLEAGTAAKRRFSTQVTWWFGGFYEGTLHQVSWTGAWNPTPVVTVEFSGERAVGRLDAGDFATTVSGTRLRLNLSPDLTVSSYVQYDSASRSVGTNSRLRWTFRAVGDLFVIYNHNVRDVADRWQRDSNQLLVKFQYSFLR